jgi:hypothetical protein
MLALHASDREPAQFVFDRGQLGGPAGLLALVISGAQPWLTRGLDVTTAAVVAQVERELFHHLSGPVRVVKTVTEKRATFCCTPALRRASLAIGDNLSAAGDYIDGPYPATLEGAVRSGIEAVRRWPRPHTGDLG